MSENKKTRSQVLKELEMACAVINEHAHGRIDVAAGHPGNFLVSHYDEDGKFTGNITGHIPFTPDPDSNVQALEKAQKLQMEKTRSDGIKECSITNGTTRYVVDWVNADKTTGSQKFPFAAEPKPEAPPYPTPVEVVCGDDRFLRYSAGYFNSAGELITKEILTDYDTARHKTWRSITTDHKSADWRGDE